MSRAQAGGFAWPATTYIPVEQEHVAGKPVVPLNISIMGRTRRCAKPEVILELCVTGRGVGTRFVQVEQSKTEDRKEQSRRWPAATSEKPALPRGSSSGLTSNEASPIYGLVLRCSAEHLKKPVQPSQICTHPERQDEEGARVHRSASAICQRWPSLAKAGGVHLPDGLGSYRC